MGKNLKNIKILCMSLNIVKIDFVGLLIGLIFIIFRFVYRIFIFFKFLFMFYYFILEINYI